MAGSFPFTNRQIRCITKRQRGGAIAIYASKKALVRPTSGLNRTAPLTRRRAVRPNNVRRQALKAKDRR